MIYHSPHVFADKARDTKRSIADWERVRAAEKQYAVRLRRVARNIGELVNSFDPDEPGFVPKVSEALARYAELIRPWAVTQARRVIQEIARRDERAWADLARVMGQSLREEIKTAPIGVTLRAYLAEHVDLITSLPLDAAKRVHDLTLGALPTGARASELAAEIRRSGKVSASRATLIARTEVARTASALTMTRAQHVGSRGYVWRTARDADVRRSHREMEGAYVDWDDPPLLSDGTVTHAGMIYNCRCYPEPVLPDTFD